MLTVDVLVIGGGPTKTTPRFFSSSGKPAWAVSSNSASTMALAWYGMEKSSPARNTLAVSSMNFMPWGCKRGPSPSSPASKRPLRVLPSPW